jgi:hypothetical protein
MINKSVRRMMMAAMKRAIMERAMVTAMGVAGNKEDKGNNEKDGVGDEGGMRRRATIATRQRQTRREYNDSGHHNKMTADVTRTKR